ncbi:DUF4142 domain-containing protein [Streptomyces sp. NPDC003943]
MRISVISSTALIAAAATAVICAPQALAAELNDQDRVFIKAAHQGNLAEIASGQDAQQHVTTSCAKAVGGVLARDQGKLDADVTALAKKLSVPLPAQPALEDEQKLKSVQAKAGTPMYDAAWLDAQEAAHNKTLALIDQELRAGKNSEVFAAAQSARPVVAMHLDLVRGGTRHAAKAPKTVRAGSGGQLAAAADSREVIGTAAVAGGFLLAAGGGWWSVRSRRRATGRS